jgi:hypothetical protein
MIQIWRWPNYYYSHFVFSIYHELYEGVQLEDFLVCRLNLNHISCFHIVTWTFLSVKNTTQTQIRIQGPMWMYLHYSCSVVQASLSSGGAHRWTKITSTAMLPYVLATIQWATGFIKGVIIARLVKKRPHIIEPRWSLSWLQDSGQAWDHDWYSMRMLATVFFLFEWLYSPCGPWPVFSFLIYSQSVGLLGRVISSSQGLYLNTE